MSNLSHTDEITIQPAVPSRWLNIVMYTGLLQVLLAESVLIFVDARLGQFVYGLLLASLLILAILILSPKVSQLFVAFSLIPMMRLFSVSLTIPVSTQILADALTAVFVLICISMYVRSYQVSLSKIGITSRGLIYQIGFALTGVLFGIILREFALDNLPEASLRNTLLLFAVVAVEELLFRGVILCMLADVLLPVKAVLYSSVLYALMFMGIDPLLMMFGFVVGIVYGLAAISSKSIVGAVLSHTVAVAVGFLYLPTF